MGCQGETANAQCSKSATGLGRCRGLACKDRKPLSIRCWWSVFSGMPTLASVALGVLVVSSALGKESPALLERVRVSGRLAVGPYLPTGGLDEVGAVGGAAAVEGAVFPNRWPVGLLLNATVFALLADGEHVDPLAEEYGDGYGRTSRAFGTFTAIGAYVEPWTSGVRPAGALSVGVHRLSTRVHVAPPGVGPEYEATLQDLNFALGGQLGLKGPLSDGVSWSLAVEYQWLPDAARRTLELSPVGAIRIADMEFRGGALFIVLGIAGSSPVVHVGRSQP